MAGVRAHAIPTGSRHPNPAVTAGDNQADAELLVCAECGRQPREDENPADDWRAFLDMEGELPVFCPECAEREFADDADS